VSELDQDMRTLAFGVGDDICGPMVTLVSITVRPGDEEKFPPIIHMHRSDSFRTIFNGDLLVGRKSYADGAARLQASGAYYGPEQPGPDSVRSSSEIWSLLVFGDKRGHRVHPADKKYLPWIEAGDAAAAPFYEKLGVTQVLPTQSQGETEIRTNLGLRLKAGHTDIDFKDAQDWPRVADVRTAVMSIAPKDSGPLVFALCADSGARIMPAATWGTELIVMVIDGAVEIGGRRYERGDVRIQVADASIPALVAGTGGLKAYVIIADRRRRKPVVDAADPWATRWSRELEAAIDPLLVSELEPAHA
jgi:hypothetical protein